MPVNRRLVATTVVLLTLLMMLQVGQASGSTPYITRLRVELAGTSDWEGLEIQNGIVQAHRIESITSGATFGRSGSHITMKGNGAPASAVVSMIVEVTNVDRFRLAQGKGNSGTSRAKIYRTNTSQTLVADITNTTTSGDSTVYKDVSRSALVGEGLTIPRVDARRLVLAFYYPWFQQGSFDRGPWYDTPSGAYRTDVASDINTMVAQAAGAGIDGFVFSWDDVGNHTARFDMLLNAAQTRAFFVTPMIELNAFNDGNSNFNIPAIEATIKKALLRSSNSRFLTTSTGQPVIFVAGLHGMAPADWRTVKNDLAAAGHRPFFLGEPVNAGYSLDGSFLYSPNGLDFSQLSNAYGAIERNLRYPALLNPTLPQKLWAATVSPGMNMSYFDKLHPRNEARNDGERYSLTWQAALSSSPEWILITSWNEWYEATHIAPSQKFGYTALNQTGNWAASFHNPQPNVGTTTTNPNNGGLLRIVNPLGK
jgi:hypothetical protein